MKVKVYQDPITREKPEGTATVLRKVSEDIDSGIRARVRFEPGESPVDRWIHPEDWAAGLQK